MYACVKVQALKQKSTTDWKGSILNILHKEFSFQYRDTDIGLMLNFMAMASHQTSGEEKL